MSTNLAPPSPDELLLSGEGHANVWQTATNRKKVMKDRKREAHNQELYRQLLQQRQVKQTLEKQPEVQPSSQPQVKLFSLAMTALDTFAQAKVNAINARNEVRPRVTAIIDGIKIDLLYDTGAMSSCLSPATYERHFSHKKLSNQHNVSNLGRQQRGPGSPGHCGVRSLGSWRHSQARISGLSANQRRHHVHRPC